MAELLQQQSVRGVFWWCRFDWSVNGFHLSVSGSGGTTDNWMAPGREQRRRRWGAPRAMLLAGTPLAARQAQRNLAIASGVTGNRMVRTRMGGWRVRNEPRRACAGWAVKRHFGHSPSLSRR